MAVLSAAQKMYRQRFIDCSRAAEALQHAWPVSRGWYTTCTKPVLSMSILQGLVENTRLRQSRPRPFCILFEIAAAPL